ncbi:MAG: YceI family protein [bacterium]|jgi:polyisoprenoid-binding protein YceI
MKKIIIFLLIASFSTIAFGQRYITKNGHVWFHSEAPLETIEAHNNQANAALDIQTGDLVFKILMKSFIFEKALMQEHFNENYVESDQFPNATFQGKVINLDEIDFKKTGSYPAMVKGNLTIHGVTKPVEAEGIFEVSDDFIHGKAKFQVAIADYNISIPGAVAGKIAEIVDVHVDITMKELK